MNITNKTFRNNRTGETIKVIDSFEDIAILENKEKLSVKSILDPTKYTEQIDPSNFFNNQSAYNNLVEKIKSIPTDNMLDNYFDNKEEEFQFKPTTDDVAIVQTSIEDEMAELARKYSVSMGEKNETNKNLSSEIENKINTRPSSTVSTTPSPSKSSISTDKVDTIQIPVKRLEDPIISMFKNTKRNVDLNISINIENKIPRLDFIEMLEDSYELSIIDFLSDEFTNKILKDPSIIRENIKNEINKLVYGDLEKNNNKKSKNKKLTARERIKKISEMRSVSEIKEYIKSEKAKTVLEAGNKRIKEIEK